MTEKHDEEFEGHKPSDQYQEVGVEAERLDGKKLVAGRGGFVDDVDMNDMLYIKVLRSPIAHGEIQNIDTSRAEQLDGVVEILTHENVPRVKYTSAGQNWPEPSPYDQVPFDTRVRFVGDRVAAVAAESPEIAQEAVQKIEVDYEEYDAVFDAEEALEDEAPRLHTEEDPTGISEPDRNVAAELHAEYGDVEEGFEKADRVIENTYEVSKVQQVPIEPHVSIGYMDEDGRLNIRTSTQVPYHVRRICAPLLELDEKDIRVKKPRIGGGFGVKQEILIEDIVGMIAKRTDRPAKLELTREEEFAASRSRHPYKIKMKTGIDEDGTIQANSMEILSNTGAHGTHGLTVASVTGSKSIPLYRANNVLFDATVAYTNLPPSGAYRGYGAPQGYFPLESHMDEVCEEMGFDKLEFRQNNHIDVDDENVMAVPLGEGGEGHEQIIKSCGLAECIEKGKEAIEWDRLKNMDEQEGPVKRGVGMAIIMQATGIPGVDMGSAWVKMNEDGSFNVHVGSTDLGTGADTVLSQIAAETLNVEPDDIILYSADTDHTPFDTGAYASSTTFVSGGAVKEACEDIREQILERASMLIEEPTENLDIEYKKVFSEQSGEDVDYSLICKDSLYANEQHQIQATASHMSYESPPPFSAHFADIEVDTETGEIEVLNYAAATDCGVPINPQSCEGQVEGGIQEAMGYALCEDMQFDEHGKMLNPNFQDYKILSSRDMPDIETIMVETHEPSGPYGAKAVAEIPMNGPAPAVANALYDATGVRIRTLPLNSEKVLNAILEQQSSTEETEAQTV